MKRWTEEEISALRSMADFGFSCRFAAMQLGRSMCQVKWKASDLKVKFRGKPGRDRGDYWERAKELAANGYRVMDASRVLGVHYSTAIYISHRLGFKWRTTQTKPRAPYVRTRARQSKQTINRMLELAERCA